MTDIGPQIRNAIVGDVTIMADVTAVYIGHPVPNDAQYPFILISENITYGDQDALVNRRSIIERDVMVYGRVGASGTANDQRRIVSRVGDLLRALFHRNPMTLANDDYHVISINALGPRIAPTDDLTTSGRLVSLTVRIE